MDTLHQPDNRYFESWKRPCGHYYMVRTEEIQGSPKFRQILKIRRDRAATSICSQCHPETAA